MIHFWGCDINKKIDECIRVIEECIFDIKIQSYEPADSLFNDEEGDGT